MDEPAAEPPAHSRAPFAEHSSATSVSASWPVLARIADVSRSEPLTPPDLRATQPSYRVDSAHEYAAQEIAAAKEYAPSPSPALPQPPASPPRRPGAKRPATSEESQTTRPLDNAPMPIKLTVGAWKKVEPHRDLIRFAALATLIIVAGMSVVLSMGSQPQQVETPHAATTTAAAEPPLTTETDTQSVEVDHGLTPMTVPADDTTSTSPTATGPLAPESQAFVAVQLRPAAMTTTPSTTKPSESLTAKPVYPTTPFAEAKLPQLADQDLPRVQTREPAVAELRGVVLETQTR